MRVPRRSDEGSQEVVKQDFISKSSEVEYE